MSAKSKASFWVVWSLIAGCASFACGGSAPPRATEPDSAERAEANSNAPTRVPPKASTLVREAESLLAKGDAQGAKAKLEEALRENARDARAYLALGLCEETLGNAPAAEAAYRNAIANDDGLAEAHNNLGLLLRDAGKDDEAITELKRAVELDPKLASAQANLAMAFEDGGRVAEARDAYDRAVALSPNDAILRANHGLFLLNNGDPQGATLSLRAGLEHAKGDRAALLAIGNGLRRAGHPDEAVRAMRSAIEAGDGEPTPALLSELALAQVAANDPTSAIASLEQALKLDPKYATGHYVLAGVMAGQGNLRGATQHYKRCIELDPKGELGQRAKQKLKSLEGNKDRR